MNRSSAHQKYSELEMFRALACELIHFSILSQPPHPFLVLALLQNLPSVYKPIQIMQRWRMVVAISGSLGSKPSSLMMMAAN